MKNGVQYIERHGGGFSLRVPSRPPDIKVAYHGRGLNSIWLLRPRSVAGRDWIDSNVEENAETRYFGNAIVVEHRYIGAIVEGAARDGLRVEVA